MARRPKHVVSRRYDVHAFALVRIKVKDVTAPSPRAAAKLAVRRLRPAELAKRYKGPNGEYAEGFEGFLVIEVDKPGSEKFFHAVEEAALEILRWLVRWREADGSQERLDEIVAEARRAVVSAV